MKLRDVSNIIKYDKKKKPANVKVNFKPIKSSLENTWELETKTKIKGSKYLLYLLGITFIFFLSVVIVAFYVEFSGTDNRIAADKISIVVNGPNILDSGANGTFDIRIVNRNPVDITNVNLLASYPMGTFSKDTNKPLKKPKPIEIGTIASGEKEERQVSAIFFGTENQELKLEFELKFKSLGSSTSLSAKATHNLTIRSTLVIVEKPIVSDPIVGKEMTFIIPIQSTSNNLISEVLVDVQYPELFRVTKVIPKIENLDDGKWRFQNFPSNERRNIIIKGFVEDVENSERVIKADVYIVPTNNSEDNILISSNETIFKLKKNFVDVDITIGKSKTKEVIARSGNELRGEIRVENVDRDSINNLIVYLYLSGSGLDISSIGVREGVYDEINQRLVWNSRSNKRLGNLNVGNYFTLPFNFKILPNILEFEQENKNIQLSVSVEGERLSTGQQDNVSNITSSRVIVSSDLQVIASSLYSTTRLKNSGPYPPRVGKTTTYSLQYFIKNKGNDLTNFVLDIPLNPIVEFNGIVSELNSKEYIYDSEEGILRVTLNRIAALGSQSTRTIEIQVSVTPTSSDIGRTLNLAGNAIFSATDTFTKKQIRSSTGGLSSAVSNEVRNFSRGTVQK